MLGEGRSPEITVATRKEAKEPKTYIMLVVAQTIGVLSRDSVVQWFGRTTIKRYVAGSIPGSDKNKKMEKLVVANIEILQCVASGVPGGHCRYQKRVTEPKTYILFVVQMTSSRVRLGQSFKTVGCGCTSCWGDVGAGSVEAET